MFMFMWFGSGSSAQGTGGRQDGGRGPRVTITSTSHPLPSRPAPPTPPLARLNLLPLRGSQSLLKFINMTCCGREGGTWELQEAAATNVLQVRAA